MKIQRKKIDVFQVTALCPECDGTLDWTGVTLMSCPPQYPHHCTKCDYKETIHSIYYPHKEYGNTERC